jgi:hypothetical protein
MRKQFSAKTATAFTASASNETQKLVVDTARLKVEVPTPKGITTYSLWFPSTQPTEITVTKLAWGYNLTDDKRQTFFSSAYGATLADLNEIYGPNTDGLDAPWLATELEPCLYMTASNSAVSAKDVECILKVHNQFQGSVDPLLRIPGRVLPDDVQARLEAWFREGGSPPQKEI